MEEMDYKQARIELEKLVTESGLAVTWVFVPLSTSRNASKDSTRGGKPCLNWRYTLTRRDRELLKGDYTSGIAHIPDYQGLSRIFAGTNAVALYVGRVCESGEYMPALFAEAQKDRQRAMGAAYGESEAFYIKKAKLEPPALVDLICSLAMDSSVLESSGFEDWASNYGLDTDSRKAESMYRECLDSALKLQAALGVETLQKMRDLANQM